MYCNLCLYTALNDFTGLEAIFLAHRTSRMPLGRVAMDTLVFFDPDRTAAKSSVTATLMIALWRSCMLISCRNFAYRVMHNFGGVRPS